MYEEQEYLSRQKGNRAYNPVWVARDLGYPDEVIQKIRKAKSEDEITRIMTTARHQIKEG